MEDELANKTIRMAWEDRTTFEEIRRKTGYSEAEVITLMRIHLKPASFRRWRKRVSGRITKHEGKFRRDRRRLKRLPQSSLVDSAQTD